ncbi:MAG: CoA-binding protein [Fidelibacterota bacterium]
MNEPETIRNIFQLKTVAVVGMSPKQERPSNYVARYLRDQGYKIIPVNPGQNMIEGEKCYPSLKAIPASVDVVDVFRRSEHVLPIVEAAIEIRAKALWLQDGVINLEAAQKAENAGLLVVMNNCMLRQHRLLQSRK